MESNLFIPTKIKVGYVKRNDTYSKKLAFVIYYDSKGKLRKEKSFEGWRDKSIPTEEFDNKPSTGFVINKDVQRSSEWFGSGRNMIRVYDNRGIEFEITCDNLIFILMTTDCLKRGLEGEFVYAWYGKELVLLPTGCEEYKKSQNFTKLQSAKIGAKMMVPGCSYKTKDMNDYIYLGHFMYYLAYDHYYRKLKKDKKQYVFISDDKYKSIHLLSGLTSLSAVNSDVPVTNYAELMEIYKKSVHSAKVSKVICEPLKNFIFPLPDVHYGNIDGVDKNDNRLSTHKLYKQDGNKIKCYRLILRYQDKIFWSKDEYLNFFNNSSKALEEAERISRGWNDKSFRATIHLFSHYELIHEHNVIDIDSMPKLEYAKPYKKNEYYYTDILVKDKEIIFKTEQEFNDFNFVNVSFLNENGFTFHLKDYGIY